MRMQSLLCVCASVSLCLLFSSGNMLDELERIYRRAGSRKLWSDIFHTQTHFLVKHQLLFSCSDRQTWTSEAEYITVRHFQSLKCIPAQSDSSHCSFVWRSGLVTLSKTEARVTPSSLCLRPLWLHLSPVLTLCEITLIQSGWTAGWQFANLPSLSRSLPAL